jgi:hypothetical protein
MENLKVIDTFLENWKQEAKKYYLAKFEEYKEVRTKTYEVNTENLKKVTKYHQGYERKYSDEKIIQLFEEIKAHEEWCNKAYNRNSTYNHIKERLESEINYEFRKLFEERVGKSTIYILERISDLDEILDKEVKVKKANIISRVEKAIGKIIDASYLKVAENSELNGIIVGENGRCKVDTITAGGWNIQCIHFRVLVKKLK